MQIKYYLFVIIEVGGIGRLKLTRDTICFSMRELVNGKRTLISAKTWKKLCFASVYSYIPSSVHPPLCFINVRVADESSAEALARKKWQVYNVKLKNNKVRK
jgi:hypothetical protein